MKTRVIRLAPLFLAATFLSGKEPLPVDLVKDLSSEEFAKREAAQAELLELARKSPKSAISELVRLSEGDDDPEIRKRSLQVLRELADVDYLSEGQGYLGILMQEELLEGGQEGNGKAGIRVLDVMKGSPAEKADLRRGDLIISLDGKGWQGVGAVTEFGNTVSAKKPLVEVTLMVKRGEPDPIAVTMKLGKRPVPDLRMAGGDLGLLEDQAKERHFKEWLRQQQAE